MPPRLKAPRSRGLVAPGLEVRVAESYAGLCREAAALIVAELKKRPNLLLCASAGGTPTGVYQQLAQRRARAPELFKGLRVLQIDEWGGVPPASPASCQADLRRKLVEPLGIDRARFRAFNGAGRPERECAKMMRYLAAAGPIDICLLGLGTNGHVAMNEPAGAFTPGPHVARLAKSSQSHALLKTLSRKPGYGLTLGLGDILRSRKALLLVSGKHKRSILKRVLLPYVSPQLPASFLWLHSDAIVLCDREAAPGVR